MLRPQIIYSFGRYILSMLTDSLITSWSLISAGGEKTVLEDHTLVLQRDRDFLQTECRHSDSSHAPWRLNLIGWSWATSERREKHEQKSTKEEEQVSLETVFLWKELIRPQIVEVDKMEENLLVIQESFFFPFCENVNNRHETQATWFICRHCTQLYSKIYSDKAWNVSRKLSVNSTVSLSI